MYFFPRDRAGGDLDQFEVQVQSGTEMTEESVRAAGGKTISANLSLNLITAGRPTVHRLDFTE